MGWWFNTAYLLALCGASPYLIWKAWRTGKYRQGWREKLFGTLPASDDDRPCLWAHAVSVGEVAALDTWLQHFETAYPGWRCLVSTTTQTGYRVACSRLGRHPVCYAPLDFTWAVRRAMQRVRPQLLVLTELELWPNWIAEASRTDVPVVVINGRLSARSYRGYRMLRPLVGPMFRRLAAVAVQDELYRERFLALGCDPDRIEVTGSLKFDGVLTDRSDERVRRLSELWQVQPGDRVLVAGSTQPQEDRVVLEICRRLGWRWPNLRGIVVPRHPEHFDATARLMAQTGLPWVRRSEIVHSADSRLLLVDTVGELRYWWGLADLAFVGGSLYPGRGGQNMLEPAAYGAAVSFGPFTWNFRDTVEKLLEHQAAVLVHNAQELEQFVERALQDESWCTNLGRRAQQLVRSHQGSAQRTLDFIARRLSLLINKQSQLPAA